MKRKYKVKTATKTIEREYDYIFNKTQTFRKTIKNNRGI